MPDDTNPTLQVQNKVLRGLHVMGQVLERCEGLTHLRPSFQVDDGVKQGCSSLLKHLSMVSSNVTFVQVQPIFHHSAHTGKMAGVQGGSELLQELVPARFRRSTGHFWISK